MSFYPLINDEHQLKELDGWLVSAIYKALRARLKLLKNWGFNLDKNFPFNVDRSNLTSEFKAYNVNGKKLLRIPSFYTIYQALKKGVTEIGVEGVMNPSSNDYDY